MDIKKYIAIVLAIVLVLIAFQAFSAPYGGAWKQRRSIGFNSTMGTSPHTIKSAQLSGSEIVSLNYHTMVQGVNNGDSVYTRGLDSLGYYSSTGTDSGLGSDTSFGLALDGFIGQDIGVTLFIMGTSAETIFVTIEQSYYYDLTMADSGFQYGYTEVDTLFVNSLNSSKDTLIVVGASAQGDYHRILKDTFTLTQPFVRFNIKNKRRKAASADMNRLHFEMYPRHTDQIMSGVSGRLIQPMQREMKDPTFRNRVR